MRVRLLHPDRDAEVHPEPRPGDADLITDLDLQPALDLMVPGRHLKDLPHLMVRPLTDPREIRWRQEALADAIARPASVRGLLDIAEGAIERQRASWMSAGRTAESLLISSLYALTAVLPSMRELAQFARQHGPTATSPALRDLFRRLVDELDADYLDEVGEVLSQLQTSAGVVVRARLTEGVMVGALELVAPRTGRRSWRDVLGMGTPGRLRVTLTEADDAGARALGELRNDAIYEASMVLAEAAHHVSGFFRQLRWEAGWYVGGVQLHRAVTGAGVGVCWPDPLTSREGTLETTGLMDLGLALRRRSEPVPNDISAPAQPLVILTGANQGGKTVLLRSVGCAQLLMQSGLFVPAGTFRSEVVGGVHTHFRRAEDDALRSGRLDEELARMSHIVDRCRPGDLVLMNESFASTDEIEGSWIAQEIIDALVGHGVRVVIVTHLHALAKHYLGRAGTLFLRAERLPDGRRSFRILPDQPLPTSHGLDIYETVFGDS